MVGLTDGRVALWCGSGVLGSSKPHGPLRAATRSCSRHVDLQSTTNIPFINIPRAFWATSPKRAALQNCGAAGTVDPRSPWRACAARERAGPDFAGTACTDVSKRDNRPFADRHSRSCTSPAPPAAALLWFLLLGTFSPFLFAATTPSGRQYLTTDDCSGLLCFVRWVDGGAVEATGEGPLRV